MRRVCFAPKATATFVRILALLIVVRSVAAQEPVFQPVNPDRLLPVELAGFGDPGNTRTAMKWFRGHLYVATERWTHCVLAATLEERFRLPLYPPPTGDCAPDPRDLSLSAEIWRYAPLTDTWEVVFTSPASVPVELDPVLQIPTRFVARDIAFNVMEVVTEPDGTEALYVGGRTYAGALALPSPLPPRLLRSVDGTTWAPIPHEPGTFLGDLGHTLEGSDLVASGFDALVDVEGTLVAVIATGAGAGMLIASDDPAAGGDAWFAASPAPEEFPVSGATAFNGRLYVGVGAPASLEGYSIYRSEVSGSFAFSFVPVVLNELLAAPGSGPVRALSFAEHGGRLYVGTAWPSEIIRIDADDSWELVVGAPGSTLEGDPLAPVSGILPGFGNAWNAQLSAMASDGRHLYVGTLDGSLLSQFLPGLETLFQHEVGFDLFRSRDGIYWHPVTKVGLGIPTQYGVSSLEPTPAGLAAGTFGIGGAQVWLAGAAPGAAAPSIGSPHRVESLPASLSRGDVILSWEPTPGAVAYVVYRSELMPVATSSTGPSGLPAEEGGSLLCDAAPELCLVLRTLGETVNLPGPFLLSDVTTEPVYVSPPAGSLPSMYFVRAVAPDGSLSGPSNVVAGVSMSAPVTFSTMSKRVERLVLGGSELPPGALRALTMVRRAAHSARGHNLVAAERMLELGELIIDGARGVDAAQHETDDLCLGFYRLRRNLDLVKRLLVPAALLQ